MSLEFLRETTGLEAFLQSSSSIESARLTRQQKFLTFEPGVHDVCFALEEPVDGVYGYSVRFYDDLRARRCCIGRGLDFHDQSLFERLVGGTVGGSHFDVLLMR